jgi:pyruvate kinase
MYQGKFNKTKIVATIGPATSSVEMLEKIILAGVDVCRLNFSHGSYEQHQEVINNIRTVNEKLGSNIALLQDLQGPKLRIGKVDGEIHLVEGDYIFVTTEEQISTTEILYVSYKRLVSDCKPGERILLNDGKVALEFVEKISDTTLKAKVIAGGPLSSNKGFNLPDSNLTVPSLTKKDLADLEYGLTQEMDWVALSFVRSADDIIELKRLIALKGTHTKVIAKIEKPKRLPT